MGSRCDVYELNGAWFDVSDHATRRALDMALDAEKIAGVLGDPRHVRDGLAGREMWTRGNLTAVVEARDGFWAVITFMWATAAAWAADRETVDSRGFRPDADRERRMRWAAKMRKRGRSVR